MALNIIIIKTTTKTDKSHLHHYLLCNIGFLYEHQFFFLTVETGGTTFTMQGMSLLISTVLKNIAPFLQIFLLYSTSPKMKIP